MKSKSELELWYNQPATRWMDALPIGNGRLGAMTYGGVKHEKMSLNESTCWSGAPSTDTDNPEFVKVLPQIQKDLFQGKNREAWDKCKQVCGKRGTFGTSRPFGNLNLRFDYDDSATMDY